MENPGVPQPRIPVATYRLQFGRGFGFSDARRIVPYLEELGISDVYASPCLKARKDSLHGYDIVDPRLLNPELGTEEEYRELTDELRRRAMGQILDIVPNHLCNDSANPWWSDVLENGPCSPYASYFDIDWEPAIRKLSGRLLLPLLGDQFGAVLERGELQLVLEDGAFFVRHEQQRYPLLPESSTLVLLHRVEELRRLLPDDDPSLTEYLSIVTALTHLPPITERDGGRIGERFREKEIIKKRLAALRRESAEIANFVDENVAVFNGCREDPKSFDLLEGLLGRQVWRLAHWRVSTDEINYRRFFDLNGFAAIRIEDPPVFEAAHELIFRLVGAGQVTGLRADHPDGLYDPAQYFQRLQQGCFLYLSRRAGPPDHGPDGPDEPGDDRETLRRYEERLASDPQYRPLYALGEKILTRGEKMPEDWPIHGSTGYAFLNSLNGIFVETGNARKFDTLYAKFAGFKGSYADLVYEKKKLVMQVAMSGEINALGYRLSALSERHRHTRDFTLNSLCQAVAEVIALFPVYRAYTNSPVVKDRDRQYIEAAVAKAKRKNPALSASIFDFLGDVLLLRLPAGFSEADAKERLDFAMRFQQMTAPVMAKGLEDTVFYVYNRLVALNEVGGSPDRFGLSLEAFHGQNLERLKLSPHALITTSTHDTKRSEDVRARVNVLSEIPDQWRDRLIRWTALNRRRKSVLEGQAVPDRNEEYLLYQTLIGAWPLDSDAGAGAGIRARIKEYMIKAAREAKVNSSWISPNAGYEGALTSFIDAILDETPGNRFLGEFLPFHRNVSYFGMLNSLAQTVLKIAAPGVPDFYQGTEVWDFSLVDPDNRRPVDFAARQRLLAALREQERASGSDRDGFLAELLRNWEDGRIKLHVTAKALACRRELHAIFMSAPYLPLAAEGAREGKVCAFARRGEQTSVLVVAPRLVAGLMQGSPRPPLGADVWGETSLLLPDEIAGNAFTNVLTGERLEATVGGGRRGLSLGTVFQRLPVAMLVTEPVQR